MHQPHNLTGKGTRDFPTKLSVLQSATPSIKSLPPRAARSDSSRRAIVTLRITGLILWVMIPLLLIRLPQGSMQPFVPWPGARIVWTVAIALLPAAIVAMGFYTWRQICPLMMLSRLSEWIGWPDRRGAASNEKRRRLVPAFLARTYPAVTWCFLFLMLTLRILVTNSDGTALAMTFLLLGLLAALTGFIYTGKSWCNFICPVGTIERIYTDCDQPQARENSQCPSCTGCKTRITRGLCPDINQENDYWQELSQPARAFSFYSFPGLVLGFYTWYFLHLPDYWNNRGPEVAPGYEVRGRDGVYDWGYYLSGDWTRMAHPWRHLMDRGFGFHAVPYIPTVIAAPLVLAVFAAVSWTLFVIAERLWLRRFREAGLPADQAFDRVRHPLYMWAAFIAFNIFYAFAGAPTLRQLPLGLNAFFHFVVIALSAYVLHTRLGRTRESQWKFDQARRWAAKWPWKEVSLPTDLNEVYHVYTVQSKSSEGRLQAYKDAVRSIAAEYGVGAAQDAPRKLAADMGIRDSDRQRVLRELTQEFPEMFDARLIAAGDELRLAAYRGELERAISENFGALPSPTDLHRIQMMHRIDPLEHAAALQALRDPEGARAHYLKLEAQEIQKLRRAAGALLYLHDDAARFLIMDLQRQIEQDREHVLSSAYLFVEDLNEDPPLASLSSATTAGVDAAVEWMRDRLPASIARPLIDAVSGPSVSPIAASPDEISGTLIELSDSSGVYTKAAALRLLTSYRDHPGVRERLDEAAQGPDALMREAALPSANDQGTVSADHSNHAQEGAPPGTIPPHLGRLDRIFALRNVELFSHLETESLDELASSAEEMVLLSGERLYSQGELGDEAFIVLDGYAVAFHETDGREERLGVINAGECVGEMAVLDPGPRMATIRAGDEGIRGLAVQGERFRTLLERDPATSYRLIRLMIKRQRRTAGVSEPHAESPSPIPSS